MADVPIRVSSDNNIDEKLRFRTSANFLCSFMTKRKYLLTAIERMALVPRYVEERIDYLGIEGYETLTFPMTCFCDIPLSKVKQHMELYGHYGVALNKSYGVAEGAQPITYLNRESDLTKDLAYSLRRLVESEERVDDQWVFLPNVLLSMLLFVKPIIGAMTRNNMLQENVQFIDECEWRYVPKMPSTLPLTLPPEHNTDSGRRAYSESLAIHRDSWFTFDVDNIDYIIVPDEEEALGVMDAIDKMEDKSPATRHKLMSKIEIGEKFEWNLA